MPWEWCEHCRKSVWPPSSWHVSFDDHPSCYWALHGPHFLSAQGAAAHPSPLAQVSPPFSLTPRTGHIYWLSVTALSNFYKLCGLRHINLLSYSAGGHESKLNLTGLKSVWQTLLLMRALGHNLFPCIFPLPGSLGSYLHSSIFKCVWDFECLLPFSILKGPLWLDSAHLENPDNIPILMTNDQQT
jgi:hypothetical protein